MSNGAQIQELSEAIGAIQQRIEDAAGRSGRPADSVCLIGVTKTHPAELIAQAVEAGLRHIGENRVQEAEGKLSSLSFVRSQSIWHLIGHLQSNKARRAALLFDYIHSVDSLHLAEALNRAVATRPQGSLPILLQVNVSGEDTKQGFALAGWEQNAALTEAFLAQLERILALPQLKVTGLMTIAPWGSEPEQARPHFASCRRLRDTIQQHFPQHSFAELSMGMSDDFEVAIEEGATLVRVGRALFGERSSKL